MEQTKKMTFHGWTMVILACLIMSSQYISNHAWNYGYAAAHEAWGITLVQIGIMASATQLAKTITNFFGGFFVEKFGYKQCLVLCGAGFAAVPILTVFFTHSYFALLVLRILAGAFSCTLYAGANLMAFENLPPQNRALAHGVILTGPNVGIMIASFFIPAMIATRGWAAGFIFAGIVVAVVVVAFTFMVKGGVNKEAVTKKQKKSKAQTKQAIKACLTKNWLLGSLSNFLITGIVMGLGTYLILFLTEEKGLSLIQAGAITGAASLVGLFINPASGIISDAIHSRKKVIIPAILLYGFSVFGFTIFDSIAALTACVFIKDSMFLFATRPLNVMVAESVSSDYVASTSGIYNAVSFFGSSFTPVIFGLILTTTGSYSTILYAVTGFSILVAVVELFMKETWTGKELEKAEESN
ncbi:MAG: MFS transporter [Eubacteriales bacterium]